MVIFIEADRRMKGGGRPLLRVHTLRPSVTFDLTTHKVEKLDCCWTRGTDCSIDNTVVKETICTLG